MNVNDIINYNKNLKGKVEMSGKFFGNKVNLKKYIEKLTLELIYQCMNAYNESYVKYVVKINSEKWPTHIQCIITFYFGDYSLSTMDYDFKARGAFNKALKRMSLMLLGSREQTYKHKSFNEIDEVARYRFA